MSPDKSDTSDTTYSGSRPIKRAICLGGGGPARGFAHRRPGRPESRGIDFGNAHSVWALSCIGAWAGVIYNQAEKGREIEETYRFFDDVFRDDKSFQSFPTNTDIRAGLGRLRRGDASNYLFEPKQLQKRIPAATHHALVDCTPCPFWVVARTGGISVKGISIAGRSTTSWQ